MKKTKNTEKIKLRKIDIGGWGACWKDMEIKGALVVIMNKHGKLNQVEPIFFYQWFLTGVI